MFFVVALQFTTVINIFQFLIFIIEINFLSSLQIQIKDNYKLFLIYKKTLTIAISTWIW